MSSSIPSRALSLMARHAALVMALVLACLAPRAMAQGTMGAAPDPISARDLDRYAERLGLSDQQFQAVQAFHDDYREAFRQLRETDIEKYLSENRNVGGGGGPLGAMFGDRKAMEKSLRDLDAIINKVKAVDNQFFDQMQSVLTEDQVSMAQRVRQSRERARYRAGVSRLTGAFLPSTRVDVSDIADDIQMDPQEKQSADPLLAQYESSLTSAVRKLHETTSTLVLEMLDKLAKQGLDDQTGRDSDRRGQVFQAVRTAMAEVYGKLQDKVSDVTDLNRRTVRTVGGVLSPDHSHALRTRFQQQAYPEASDKSTTDRAFEVALGFSELTDDQRAALQAFQIEYYTGLDRLNEQMADLIDENRKSQSLLDFDSEKRRKFEQDMDEQRDKRTKLSQSAEQNLRATLGPDLSEALDKRVAQGKSSKDDEGLVIRLEGSLGPGGGIVATRIGATVNLTIDAPAPDPFIPTPITKHDIDVYASRLDLTSDNKTVLGTIHDDYMEKYKAIEDNQIKTVREAARKLWSTDDSSGAVTPPTDQAIDDLYNLRRQVFAAIAAVDAEFFEDVPAILTTDAQSATLKRLVLSRQRDVYIRSTGSMADMLSFGGRRGRGQGGPGGPGGGSGRNSGGNSGGNPGGGGMSRAFRFVGSGSSQSSIDLASVVDGLHLAPSDPAQFQAALLDYEQSATGAFQALYEASMRVQMAMDKMRAQGQRAQADDRSRGQGGPGGGFQSVMQGEGRAARDAQQALVALNKSALTKLTSSLPENDSLELRRAYFRKAFPDVFRDTRSAEPHLTDALSLSDLSDEQRTQIQQLAAEFHGSYDQVSEKMVDLESAASDMFAAGGQNRDWQAMQDQVRTREKLDFERNDLNDKTLAHLRAALNEDQIQRLGGLRNDQVN